MIGIIIHAIVGFDALLNADNVPSLVMAAELLVGRC
jgi:hypothetical protein